MTTGDGAGGTWRAQFLTRPYVGAPEIEEGYFEFTDEAEARAFLNSDRVQARRDECWRLELRYRPPWVTVVAGDYQPVEEVGR